MKKNCLLRNKYLVFLVLAILQIFLSGNRKHQKDNPGPHLENRYWSGTITMEQSTSGIVGTSQRHVTVSFNNALPTLNRESETGETDFTDNKGTGSETFEGEGVIEGKRIGKSSCSGSGKTELHAVDIDKDGNYYIHAIGPSCTGTSENFITHEVANVEPYTTDITISDRVIGPGDILSGSNTKVSYIPDEANKLGTVITTITWHLVRSTANDVELIVMTPEDYEEWLPEPGENELKVGSILNISLKLQKRGGGITTKKAKAFDLRLSNTSKEPGITVNFPVVPMEPQLPDLRFQKQANAVVSPDFQRLSISCPGGCQISSAKLGSYDGGGWTVLTVEAILTDNSRIQGRLLVSNGEVDIRIPKREPNSKIGEKWLKENDSPNEEDDKETSKGNNNDGDGLSAYEEYRGVISEGIFKRLDPKKKEVGIKVDEAEYPIFSRGIGWFEKASDVEPVIFYEKEIAGKRVNSNSNTAHIFDQYALLLYKGLLGHIEALGCAFSSNNHPDIPANTTAIVIDVAAVYREYNGIVARERSAALPFTALDMLANTVAHELGHGINIWHHGEVYVGQQIRSQLATVDSVPPYRIFHRNGAEELTRPYPLIMIGKSGTQESGDVACIMAYYPYYNWAYTVGADGARIFNEVPLIPVGTSMCNSNAGTKFNHSIIYFGNAVKGNCLKQIKLK